MCVCVCVCVCVCARARMRMPDAREGTLVIALYTVSVVLRSLNQKLPGWLVSSQHPPDSADSQHRAYVHKQVQTHLRLLGIGAQVLCL